MKSYLEYLSEDPDNQNRNDAILARTRQLANKAEAEVDKTGSPEARKKMTNLRRRELEGISGVSFADFTKAFNKVHPKNP